MRTLRAVAVPAAIVVAFAALVVLAAQAQQDAVVTEILIKGDTGDVTREDILKAIRTKVGDKVLEDRLGRDADRIKDMGPFAAVTYSTEKVRGGVHVTFEIAESPEPPAPADPGTGEATTEPPPPPEGEAPPPLVPFVGGTDPGPAKIGVVTWTKVRQDWKAAAKLQLLLRELADERLVWQRLEKPYRQQVTSLSKDEADEAARLRFHTPDPSNKDLARLQELEKMALERDTEFVELQGNPDRDADQTRRYQELQDARRHRRQEIDQMEEELTAQWDAREEDLRYLDELALQTILELVAELAQAQGLAYVFRADITTFGGNVQTLVLYGGKDITAELVDELNEKVPELRHEEPPE